MKRGKSMKVVELKKVKLFVFFFIIAALLLFIYISKRTSINEASERRFKAMQDFMQHRQNPNHMFDNQFGNIHRFRNKNVNRQLPQVDKIIDFTFSSEELNENYENNMKEKIEDEEVDFVPNKGQHFKKLETGMNNNGAINVGKISNNGADSKVYEVIDVNKNSFIQKKKIKAKIGKNIPVYEMPQRFPQKHNMKPFTSGITTTIAQADEIPKDYKIMDKDEEEEEEEEFSLIHNFLASKVVRKQATHKNLPTSVPQELYVLNHNMFVSHLVLK